MDNYPPGVTGREFEIAGPDSEWEEEFECDNSNFQYVMIPPSTFKFCSDMGKLKWKIEGQNKLEKNWYHYASMMDVMFNNGSMTTEVQTEECGFAGDVIKYSYRDNVWWDCPRCGKTYETNINTGDNYD